MKAVNSQLLLPRMYMLNYCSSVLDQSKKDDCHLVVDECISYFPIMASQCNMPDTFNEYQFAKLGLQHVKSLSFIVKAEIYV